ncbi:MAG: SDR family oxidoreductase, partial [Lachnospiraceae bacterium]
MAKIFITGINGFFGKNLANYLRRQGHEVTGGSRVADKEKCVEKFDLGSSECMYQALALHQPDVIIHTAALSSVTEGRTLDYYEVNTLGTENLLNAVDRLQKRTRFLYVSTAGVYGNQATDLLHEDLVPNPVSHYGVSKFAAECLVRAEFSKRHDVTVIRPFNIIGVG